jgi:hypothetical protein
MPPDTAEYKGKIWSFTTEPEGVPLTPEHIFNVSAEGSADEDQEPNSTSTGKGLDDVNDTHSTNEKDMWLGIGEPGQVWIQYEFDKIYKLYDMLVWNYNEPSLFDVFGAKDVNITYSIDGNDWTALDGTAVFNPATGEDTYKANTDILFNGAIAQYVRLTFWSSWAGEGSPIYGISEVRFSIITTRATVPVPADEATDIAIDAALIWKAGREALEHDVYYSTDEEAVKQGTATVDTVTDSSYSPSLALGRVYYWRVDEVNDLSDYPVWASDIWSFTTKEFNVIDNFEVGYDDTDVNAVWATWIDGTMDSARGGSQIGYDYPGPYLSTTNHSGRHSAPLNYDNSSVAYSEAERTFDPTLNINIDGADEFLLYYRGSSVTFQEASDGSGIAMSGEGADIWGNEDQFRYAYMTLSGNGSMTVRLDSLQNVTGGGGNSKAGIMIRESLEDANSVMAMVCLHANGGTALQYRDEQSANVEQDTTTGIADRIAETPVWLRITRQGSTITGERSFDGENWEPIGEDPNVATTADITMPNQVYIGLFVCSHVTDTLGIATFYGVETSSSVTGDWTVVPVGDPDQADGTNTLDKLYVRIEDSAGKSKTVYEPEIAVGQGSWKAVVIPYSDLTAAGLNLTKIKKIAVGVGDPSNPLHGAGIIYIDDVIYGHQLDAGQ